MEKTDMILCQSCGMPMTEELWGTEKDGSRSADYCRYCYVDGAFTKEETMQQMIDTCVPFMVEEGMAENEAREMMGGLLPQLKRWKQG